MATTSRARQLRKDSTQAELTLWRHVRGRQLAGWKFRRQVPLGQYIVDFVCFERRLIVELDGGHHQDQAVYDNHRTEWLESQGFRVLRFWNNEVLGQLEAVGQAILRSAGAPFGRVVPAPRPSPSPQPSPVKGEGEEPPSPRPSPVKGEGEEPSSPPQRLRVAGWARGRACGEWCRLSGRMSAASWRPAGTALLLRTRPGWVSSCRRWTARHR